MVNGETLRGFSANAYPVATASGSVVVPTNGLITFCAKTLVPFPSSVPARRPHGWMGKSLAGDRDGGKSENK
jgi:hypothetical protein